MGSDWNSAIKRIDKLEADEEHKLTTQIDDAVREDIRAAKRSGKKASVTVKLTFNPLIDRRINISGDLKKTLPQPPTSSATAFADPEEGTLHDHDPYRVVQGLPGVDLGEKHAPKQEAGAPAPAKDPFERAPSK